MYQYAREAIPHRVKCSTLRTHTPLPGTSAVPAPHVLQKYCGPVLPLTATISQARNRKRSSIPSADIITKIGRLQPRAIGSTGLEQREFVVLDLRILWTVLCGSQPAYGSTHHGVVAPAGIIQTQVAPGVQYSSQRPGC
jgi:hypothetical protein